MTTPDRLDQIRHRSQAATPGPWWAFDRTHDNGLEIAVGEPDPDGYPTRKLPEGFKTDIGRREDAEFIAHARQDVPWLLDLLAELAQLTTRDVHPEADVRQHDDPGSVFYIAGMDAALKTVRKRIAAARATSDPTNTRWTPPTTEGDG